MELMWRRCRRFPTGPLSRSLGRRRPRPLPLHDFVFDRLPNWCWSGIAISGGMVVMGVGSTASGTPGGVVAFRPKWAPGRRSPLS